MAKIKPGDLVVIVPNQNEWNITDDLMTRCVVVKEAQNNFWVVWPYLNTSSRWQGRVATFPGSMLRVFSGEDRGSS